MCFEVQGRSTFLLSGLKQALAECVPGRSFLPLLLHTPAEWALAQLRLHWQQ